jgi:uncharacterized protein YkwD
VQLARPTFVLVCLLTAVHTPIQADEPDHPHVALARDVLTELNLLRDDPAAYAVYLEEMRGKYQGTLLTRGTLAPIQTVEGEAALIEAIDELKGARRARAMRLSDGLTRAASDHVRDQGPTGGVGHRGSDGSNSLIRISRHGRSSGRSGEVIDYGWTNARDVVVDLLIDDGIADRGHRRSILDPRYSLAGVSCGGHSRYRIMCVVEMAERFRDDASDITVAQGGQQ